MTASPGCGSRRGAWNKQRPDPGGFPGALSCKGQREPALTEA